ncbi:MAG: DsbA family protein [Bdellovibrionales bacterium]
MRLTAFPLVLATLALAATGAAQAAESPKSMSDSEKEAVQKVIKEYLTNEHPEIVLDALKELKKRDEVVATAKMKEAIASKKKELFEDPASPVGGNPKGDVSVVEFFDYQCGYCKIVGESVEKLLKDDKNVRFVYKEFPVLGPMSLQASKAATASFKQGSDKYIAFHNALMKKKGHFTKEEDILEIAKTVGLNVEKLRKDMQDEAVTKQVQASLDLGGDIGARGTPMFIIGDQAYPGALDESQLKEIVQKVRESSKKKEK